MGRDARLTIGPWSHASPGGMAASIRDGLEWFDGHLREMPSRLRRHPVRLFVMGARRWIDLPAWPPEADNQTWHLQPGGRLSRVPPVDSGPDQYRYDPADPTPGVGGPSLDWGNAGPKPQRRREDRPDVLTYTSEAISHDLTIAGPLTARLYLRSSLDHTDFYVRLCDVSPKGKSINLSDGIVRLRPGDTTKSADGSFPLRIAMWPTANRFGKGHRIRLQVSSGAHPLFVRNLGGGESLVNGTRLRAADQEVFHDPVSRPRR
jgi:putative CocE/NonD family hydrolase